MYQSHTVALLITPASASSWPTSLVDDPSGISTSTVSSGSPEGSISPWTHDHANQAPTPAAASSTTKVMSTARQPRRRDSPSPTSPS